MLPLNLHARNEVLDFLKLLKNVFKKQVFLENVFGAKDMQTSENYALQRAAIDNQAMLPDAASAVLENIYMDNQSNSFESMESANKLSHELSDYKWYMA